MGVPELIENPRYATNEVRMRHNDELQAMVSGWVAERPRDEVLKILDEFEVVCSQVNDASDIVEDPHFQERTLVELTGSETLGRVLLPGPVVHVEGYPGPAYDGVPGIGQHTREVLGGLLSLSDDDLAALADAGTVRVP
jgi:crotonobetainyl-CoA:carnitine CoA-transferase CaiB-like acyl-CoA transferase